jgi:hypothetical protein
LKTKNRNVGDVLLDTTELILLHTAEPKQPELKLGAAIDLGPTHNNDHVNVELDEATGELEINVERVQLNDGSLICFVRWIAMMITMKCLMTTLRFCFCEINEQKRESGFSFVFRCFVLL